MQFDRFFKKLNWFDFFKIRKKSNSTTLNFEDRRNENFDRRKKTKEQIAEEKKQEEEKHNEIVYQVREENRRVYTLPIKYFISLNKFLFFLNIVSFLFLIVLILEHFSFYPLIKKQYRHVEFLNSLDTVVKIQTTQNKNNEGIIERDLRRYVIEREEIRENPSEVIQIFTCSKSTLKMYLDYQEGLKKDKIREKLKRFVNIVRYQKIENNIREIEITTKDIFKNKKDSVVQSWIVKIKYEFKDQILSFDQRYINPSGICVSKYKIEKV